MTRARQSPSPQTVIRIPHIAAHPRSPAQRWVHFVIAACHSEDDPRTLGEWARCAGVSYSSLGESCRLLNIRPQLARDFARGLRALIKAREWQCSPELLLDFRDRRTLNGFLARAGYSFASKGEGDSVARYLEEQLFIPCTNHGLRLLVDAFRTDRFGDTMLPSDTLVHRENIR